MSNIILASSSPRRLELLSNMGFACTVVKSSYIERQRFISESPTDYVESMALNKGEAVACLYPNSLVLSADTVVSLGNTIYGKPQSFDHFMKMMKDLSLRTHVVFTSFAIFYKNKQILKTVSTEVTMSYISDEDIKLYWLSKEPIDKAGGYAIQGIGGMFVSKLNGSYSSVVGLPQVEVREEILKLLKV